MTCTVYAIPANEATNHMYYLQHKCDPLCKNTSHTAFYTHHYKPGNLYTNL